MRILRLNGGCHLCPGFRSGRGRELGIVASEGCQMLRSMGRPTDREVVKSGSNYGITISGYASHSIGIETILTER